MSKRWKEKFKSLSYFNLNSISVASEIYPCFSFSNIIIYAQKQRSLDVWKTMESKNRESRTIEDGEIKQ